MGKNGRTTPRKVDMQRPSRQVVAVFAIELVVEGGELVPELHLHVSQPVFEHTLAESVLAAFDESFGRVESCSRGTASRRRPAAGPGGGSAADPH